MNYGIAVYVLYFSELLATLIDEENVKKHYKNRLVGTVLNGYLSLRKLVVQRTKLIDETQEKLLELLEEMTTGKCMLHAIGRIKYCLHNRCDKLHT